MEFFINTIVIIGLRIPRTGFTEFQQVVIFFATLN